VPLGQCTVHPKNSTKLFANRSYRLAPQVQFLPVSGILRVSNFAAHIAQHVVQDPFELVCLFIGEAKFHVELLSFPPVASLPFWHLSKECRSSLDSLGSSAETIPESAETRRTKPPEDGWDPFFNARSLR